MNRLTRRQVLAAGAAATLSGAATSCGTEKATTPTTTRPSANSLVAMFPRGEPYVAAGTANRLPFVIASADGAPLDSIDGPVTFTVTTKGERIGEPLVARERSSGLERPVVPLLWTPPASGFYEISARYQGRDLDPIALQAFDAEKIPMPSPGSTLPVIPTPTTADARGVEPICTADPPCPLHRVELSAQRSTGRPVAVLVSTPAFCQTAVCGPVLEIVVAATRRYESDLDVIHAEVYANPTAVGSITEATTAPVVEAFGLLFEPCLLVADSSGIVTNRLDIAFDADEVDEAFRNVTA